MNTPQGNKQYRIAIAGFLQESVTFIEELTTLEQFQAVELAGPELIKTLRGSNTGLGGIIDVCEREQADIVPLFYTSGGAAGPISDEAYDHYVGRLIEGLKQAAPLDGVLLDLHGAMVTPTRLDADRETLERVRATVGPDVPVMVALDYHANLDAQTIAQASAVFGYHFSPHTDMGKTGERAADCLFRTLRGEINPVSVLIKPDVMVPSIFSATGMEPLKSIVLASIDMAEKYDGYLDVSVFAGFSYADVPNCGFSVVAITDRDAAAAQKITEQFSTQIWQQREALSHRELVYSVEDGIEKAKQQLAAGRRPIVLLEHADRMHDSTYLLRAVLEQDLPKVAVPLLWDPYAVAEAMKADVGSHVELKVGGHSSGRAGGPVTLAGKLVHAGPVSYRATGPYYTGRIVQLGNVAVIDTGKAMVSLTSLPSTAVDDDCLRQFGRSLDEFDYIVLRSKTHFRAFFEPVSADILIIDTPDWGPADLTLLPYRHVPVDTIYPFNAQAAGSPAQ
ncbi:M81 family metallopeptidase [Pusillimonas sp. SM2304]|uniref:M81 family metallopeptidase n=1 Tax=Pusillimonas sp. SM2304 TaxID=3073241 RepID=UPI00287527DF|nr:M81 family metallopeptidase [Pusillimonas sp. SM2304]MDS1138887.1 M81 family metallopeptidase [Pusillimonas sp. SM2304]